MDSSLSVNRMANMPAMLEPIGRPSLWRKTCSLKGNYRLCSVTWRRSETSCLERLSTGFLILSEALVMASCVSIVV